MSPKKGYGATGFHEDGLISEEEKSMKQSGVIKNGM